MIIRPFLAALILALAVRCADAQPRPAREDSLRTIELEPIVVTAARAAETLGSVTVPTTVVGAQSMQEQGAVRLTDVLANIAGLALVDDHGTGLQVQGFAPDYTLVLLNGEPIIGRTAGTLDLSRLSVHGLDRVEVVHGPSSSLYGSEALAGVVNLVSRAPEEGYGGKLGLRLGSYGTTNATTELAGTQGPVGARLLVNRFASSGYDLTPASYGQTAPAFEDWTADLRARGRLSERLVLRLGARGTSENQHGAFAALDGNRVERRFDSEGRRSDWSVHPELDLNVANGLRLTATLYAARYMTEVTHRRQDDAVVSYRDDFDQHYRKAELQLDASWRAHHLTTAGGGVIRERIGGDRYEAGSGAARPSASQAYAFFQHLWDLPGHVKVVASARYDAHSEYAARFTPRLSMLVRPSERLRLRASVGSGFKAPAFRQLYLAYTNPAAGYSVFGTTQVRGGIERLRAEGQIEQLFFAVSTLEEISAERSMAVNAGGSADPFPWLAVSLNGFYNDVHDLIETQPIARKTNGQFVFGYFNLARIYTRGAEASATIRPMRQGRTRLAIRLGYQYLQARDRDLVSALQSGTVFGRDPDGREYRLGLRQYAGMFGRSPHSATLGASVLVAPLNLMANLRGRWRSRYGYRDLDGNALANRNDEFVGDYGVFDVTLSRRFDFPFSSETQLQLGAHNLFDITRPEFVPSLPGRRVFAALHLSL